MRPLLSRLEDLPLRQKIGWAVAAASLATLLISALAVVVYEVTTFRPGVLERLHREVELAHLNLAAAIDFFDRAAAQEVLETLGAQETVRAIGVFDAEGHLFASYSRDGSERYRFPQPLPEAGVEFHGEHLALIEDLGTEDGRVGSLYVHLDLPPLLTRLPQYSLMIAAVSFALLAASLILVWSLRPLLTEPIRRLTRAVEQVREAQDYSVRVDYGGRDEVGRLTRAFNELLATIEERDAALKNAAAERENLQEQLYQAQKMESIGRLAGGVAHDFNNLLTVILGSTELSLGRIPEGSPLRPLLANIENAGQQASDLTRRLLAFARRQVVAPRVLDLNRFILDLEAMLRRLIGEDVELRVVPTRDVGCVNIDPGQLTQVLMNLAVNAREAMPDGGTLTLETLSAILTAESVRAHPGVDPGRYVVLTIADSGEGMSEETLAHLFEPFFTTKPEGTGLGLATCYGIVRQGGGHIWATSSLGFGTTFHIYLPLTEEAEEREELKIADRDLVGKEIVLVVEDNQLVRTTAVALLRAQGYRVLEAASGSDALSMVKQLDQPLDLVIADVVMPEMSGPEVAHRLQAMRPNLKVLFVSGYVADGVEGGQLPPGTRFLPKPYTSQTLLRETRALLDGSGHET